MELYENFWEKIQTDGAVPKYIITICMKPQFKRMDDFAMKAGYMFQRRFGYASMYKKL